jgi:hypothetical protein
MNIESRLSKLESAVGDGACPACSGRSPGAIEVIHSLPPVPCLECGKTPVVVVTLRGVSMTDLLKTD